jgi:hypothetical protein
MNFAGLLERFLTTSGKRVAWIVGLGILALGLISFYQGGTDRARAEAEIQSREKLIELQDRTITAKDKQIEARAAETAQAKKQIEALRRRPATVREIAREIPQFITMPGTPILKMSVFGPEANAEGLAVENQEAKTKDGWVVFDSPQARSLRKFYLDCAEQKIDLNACQGDLGDVKVKAEAERLRAELFKDQRDAAVRGMKGGSAWQRFGRNAKMVGVGIILGVAGGIALTR